MVFFLTSSLISQYLYPILMGKVKPKQVEEVQWVYGENLESRTIAFLEFENLSKNQAEIYDNYKTSLPRIIAERVKNEKVIETPTNDFIPVRKNVNNQYLVKEISFTDAEKNPVLMSEVFNQGTVISLHLVSTNANLNTNTNQGTNTNTGTTNTQKVSPFAPQNKFVIVTNTTTNQTSLGEVVKVEVVTNQVTVDPQSLSFFSALTNRQVAYFYTNIQAKKYIFYIFNKNPQLYFDPQLIVPYEKYFISNKALDLPLTSEGHLYYPLDKSRRKNLILYEKLFRLNDAPLGNVLSQANIHYFIYGSFSVDRNNMELNLYVINTYEKQITHIFREKFLSSQIREKSKLLDTMVMSFLQQKRILRNVSFSSTPPGAMLNLNGRFIGNLPQTLNHWLEGDYTYEVWLPNQTPSKVVSDAPVTDKTVSLLESRADTRFFFEGEKKGQLAIRINNGIPGDYYINSKLMAKNKSEYREDLYPGEYFVSVSKSNYVTRNFKINVEPENMTSLSFGIKEVKPKSQWEEIFLNYERNTKIFATLGFALGAASFGTFIHTLKLEDQKNSYQKRVEDLDRSNLDSTTEKYYRDEYNTDYNKFLSISLGLFSGSVISFLTMLTFHTLDVWENLAPIETTFNHRGDVEIKYSKDF